MIITNKDDVLTLLHSSPFTFYLTGSRFFGTSRPDSDWDFYTQYSQNVYNWLHENNFEEIGNNSYADGLSAFIFKRDNFHIQLVNNANLKTHIQEVLFKYGLLEFHESSKSYARSLWSAMAEISFHEFKG